MITVPVISDAPLAVAVTTTFISYSPSKESCNEVGATNFNLSPTKKAVPVNTVKVTTSPATGPVVNAALFNCAVVKFLLVVASIIPPRSEVSKDIAGADIGEGCIIDTCDNKVIVPVATEYFLKVSTFITQGSLSATTQPNSDSII